MSAVVNKAAARVYAASPPVRDGLVKGKHVRHIDNRNAEQDGARIARHQLEVRRVPELECRYV